MQYVILVCKVYAVDIEVKRNWERSVLTLSYLCLPCCVRDTA